MTCPECRHVVDVLPGKTVRCHNCRTKIAAPADSGTAADSPESPPTSSPETTSPITPPQVGDQVPASTPPGPAGIGDETTPNTAAIVTFVFGMLFFIPLVTQVIALVVGCLALVTRKPSQRMKLAWIGMTVAILTLIGWLTIFTFAGTSFQAGFNITGLPYAQQNTPSDWQRTSRTAAAMERIQRAALAYQRDFEAWPGSTEALAGHGLPPGFSISEDLQYRPVPLAWYDRLEWVLIVSDELNVDRDGEALARPHRLVARLDGSLELLPAAEVDAILAGQLAE